MGEDLFRAPKLDRSSEFVDLQILFKYSQTTDKLAFWRESGMLDYLEPAEQDFVLANWLTDLADYLLLLKDISVVNNSGSEVENCDYYLFPITRRIFSTIYGSTLDGGYTIDVQGHEMLRLSRHLQFKQHKIDIPKLHSIANHILSEVISRKKMFEERRMDYRVIMCINSTIKYIIDVGKYEESR